MPTKMASHDHGSSGHHNPGSNDVSKSKSHKSKKRHKDDAQMDTKKHKYSMPIEECRRMYKNEIEMLWREVEEFRKSCREQMEKQKMQLAENQKKYEDAMKGKGDVPSVPDIPHDFTQELKKLEKNMSFLERNQGLLDQEKDLVEKEELLAKRQEKLKDYEKEVEDAEALLNKRQTICDKRVRDVENLNDDRTFAGLNRTKATNVHPDQKAPERIPLIRDLLQMKQEFISSVEALESKTGDGDHNDTEGHPDHLVNSPEASVKARRHWTIARRHLIDKVTLLETTVQRYRTQLASSSASVTAKDLLITRLNNEITDLKEDGRNKQIKIKQLESQLSITIEEKMRSEKNFEMLMEELQNIDLSSSQKHHHSPQHSPKQNGAVKQKLLRKQNSSLSFFTHDSEKHVTNHDHVTAGHSFKDNFKRKILNVHTNSHPTSQKWQNVNNTGDGEGKRERHSSADAEENATDEKAAHSYNKRVVNGLKDRITTEAGSKACAIM